MQREHQSILDIIDSINLIFEYNKDIDWDSLSIKDQDAIIRRFMVIGEATKRLSIEFRNRYPQLPWKKMAGLRDIIVHEYDDINLDIIRDIIELELPRILPLLQALVAELDETDC